MQKMERSEIHGFFYHTLVKYVAEYKCYVFYSTVLVSEMHFSFK